jgi:penicillin-binding protein 2
MKFLDDLNNSLIGDDKIRKINKEFDESYDIENFDIEPKKKKKNLVFHYVILISMILMLFAKIFILQVVEGKHYRELAEGNRLRTRMVDAPRGLILDKNGKSLVENKPQFVLTLNAQDLPKEKKERDIIAQKVASLLPISKEEILKKMKNYENIFDPIILYENITREESISLKEKLSNIICLEIQEKLNREYARDYGVAHI